MKSISLKVAGAVASALVGCSLFAQSAVPASGGSSSSTDDQTIEISPFVVTAHTGDSDRVTETTSGTLVSRPLDKLPMGISVVGSEEMKKFDIFNADNLSLLAPGLAAQTNATTQGDTDNTSFTSRGFTVLPHLDGVAPGGRLFDMTAIDRVEIIRGPNSLLYGQSDPGGVVNFITKRAILRNRTVAHGDLSVAGGNYDFYRAEMDVDATLVPGTLGFRLPASYTDASREFAYYRNITDSINPSILWRVFPNTEINFEYDYLKLSTNPAAFRPIIWTKPGASTPFIDPNNQGLGRDFNLYGPYSIAHTYQRNWFLDVTSRLNDHITVHGIYSRDTRDDNDATLNFPGGGIFVLKPDPNLTRALDVIDGNSIRDYKVDVLGEWTFGQVKTRTIAGYEFNDNVYHLTGSYVTWANNASNYINSVNFALDPTTGMATHIPTASEYTPFPTPLAGSSQWQNVYGPVTAESKWTNARVSEVLSAFDDRVQLLGGVARGKSTLVNTTTGAEKDSSKNVYQIGIGAALDQAKHQLLFVNKSTSYQPQFVLDINGNPLPATTADGIEGGLKSTWGSTGLTSTITIFDQKRVNVGRQYFDPSLNRSYGILTPGEESKGAELELYYRVNSHVSVTANYTQFQGRITGANATQQYLIGREIPRAPEKSGNLILTLSGGENGALANSHFTIGAKYLSSSWLDTSEGQTTESWYRSTPGTTAFLEADKSFRLSSGNTVTVRLNVGNVFNRNYITEAFTYGEPRTVRLSADYHF